MDFSKTHINHLNEFSDVKIILKDSNILLEPTNSLISAFGALNLNKNYFIDWFPLY